MERRLECTEQKTWNCITFALHNLQVSSPICPGWPRHFSPKQRKGNGVVYIIIIVDGIIAGGCSMYEDVCMYSMYVPYEVK